MVAKSETKESAVSLSQGAASFPTLCLAGSESNFCCVQCLTSGLETWKTGILPLEANTWLPSLPQDVTRHSRIWMEKGLPKVSTHFPHIFDPWLLVPDPVSPVSVPVAAAGSDAGPLVPLPGNCAHSPEAPAHFSEAPIQVLWWCQRLLAPCLQPTLSSTTKKCFNSSTPNAFKLPVPSLPQRALFSFPWSPQHRLKAAPGQRLGLMG